LQAARSLGGGFGAGNELGRRDFLGRSFCRLICHAICHTGGIAFRLSRQTWILLFAAIIAFGGCLWGSFHFDDYSLFSSDLWRPFDIRPLTYLTFWLNDLVGGRNPWGYHAVNLFLHLAAVLLLFEVLKRLISPKAAWIAAAIFAVHPFQAEPVNYIFARSIALATVLCLASLASWIAGHRWWAVAWFGAALLAKEECVAFPALLLLLEGWKLRGQREKQPEIKRVLRPIVAMFALSVLAGIRVFIAIAQTPGAPAGAQAGIPWQAYGLAQGLVILRYLRMLVLPWGFSVDPDIAIPPAWLGILAWLALGLLAAAAAMFALRGKQAGLWLLAGFILLLPSSSVLPVADLAADRRLYLPMIGFAAVAGVLLERVRPPVVVAGLAILTALSAVRTQTWRTEASLWEDGARKAPNKVRPKIQLARAVEPARAIEILEEARRIAPDNALIPSEEGRIYLSLGKPDLALVAFGRALALEPRSADALNNRGAALLALDQRPAAQADFERALAIDACQFDARLNLERLGVPIAPAPGCKFSRGQRSLLGK
jgi:protein O-mannosyl-transferase